MDTEHAAIQIHFPVERVGLDLTLDGDTLQPGPNDLVLIDGFDYYSMDQVSRMMAAVYDAVYRSTVETVAADLWSQWTETVVPELWEQWSATVRSDAAPDVSAVLARLADSQETIAAAVTVLCEQQAADDSPLPTIEVGIVDEPNATFEFKRDGQGRIVSAKKVTIT